MILGSGGPVDAAVRWAGGGGFDWLYTPAAVLIGLVYGELPFMVLPLYASLEKLDGTLLEASADLGAGGWETFRRVTLPLSGPGLAAGTVLVFIPSFGQFVVSDLLGGEKAWLAGNLIQFQFTDVTGSKPLGAAVSVIVMGAVLVMLMVYAVYAREGGRTRSASGAAKR